MIFDSLSILVMAFLMHSASNTFLLILLMLTSVLSSSIRVSCSS